MSNQRSGMHLLVLGGTGATGRVVVGQAFTGGHSARSHVRSPEKLGIVDSRLELHASNLDQQTAAPSRCATVIPSPASPSGARLSR
jgi:short subunit dehydrogenase-like uncharacterized protein